MSYAASYSHGCEGFSLVKVKNVSELNNLKNAYGEKWKQSSKGLVYDIQTLRKKLKIRNEIEFYMKILSMTLFIHLKTAAEFSFQPTTYQVSF